MYKLRGIGEQLLPAIAYGDAAGLPVETKSHAEIAEEYGFITELIPVQSNPYYVGDFPVGTWSDDTQLSIATAKALLRHGDVSMAAIADEHVIAYNETPFIKKANGNMIKRGWGGSTTASVERYIAGVPLGENGEIGGTGNGVIMKLAPLAYWLIARGEDKEQAYVKLDSFTSFTHDSDVPRVATRVHYDVLKCLADDNQVRSLGGLRVTTGVLS